MAFTGSPNGTVRFQARDKLYAPAEMIGATTLDEFRKHIEAP